MAVAIEHRREMLAALVEIFEDFPSFAGLCDIRTKSEGILRFRYERWTDEQKAFERDRSGWDLVLKGRQIGFSTLELIRDLHQPLSRKGHNTLVVTHDEKLKAGLFEGVRFAADRLRQQGLLPRTRHDNACELVFADFGSSIRITEAGATERSADAKGRSGTIQRLHATELSAWPQAETTMGALLAAVPNDGEVVIESTARGAGGLFYKLVQDALAGTGRYRFHFFPWYRHRAYRRPIPRGFDPRPRDRHEEKLRAAGCTDQQLVWWRTLVDDVAFGLEKALQEYPIDVASCFRSSGRIYIPSDTIDALEAQTHPPLRKVTLTGRHTDDDGKPAHWTIDVLVFEEHDPTDSYVIGSDVAEGVEADASAADCTSRRTGRTVATMHSDTMPEGDWGRALCAFGRLYGNAELAPERNGPGRAVLRAIEREGYNLVYQADDGKDGWVTTPASRPPLFDELRTALIEKHTSHPDAAFVAEAKTLIRDTDGRPRAKGKGTRDGCRDDRFVAKGIAWQVRQRPRVIVGYRNRVIDDL